MKGPAALMLGLAGTVVLAQQPVTEQGINVTATADCEVTQLLPQSANFFSFGRTPRVGDKIELDLSANEIDDLTFQSGARIPLKEIGAKLVRNTKSSILRFEGTHQGSLGFYRGLLFGFVAEQQADLTVQVLRDSELQGFQLHSLRLTCNVTN